MVEIWRDIPDWEGLYQVSNLGRVRSLHKQPRILKQNLVGPQSKMYLAVGLYRSGIRKTGKIHLLVLKAFIGQPSRDQEGCHFNDNINDNRLENLYWGTKSHNQMDSVRNGTHFNSQKDTCRAQHQFTSENTYWWTDSKGQLRRQCKQCQYLRNQKQRLGHSK